MSAPISRILYPFSDNEIFIKREDLLPFSFGGNKFRIAQEYIYDMEKKNKDCIIGYGSSSSNLNRVLANLCMAKDIPCYIVSPMNDDGLWKETYNSKAARICGAKIVICKKEEVASAIAKTRNQCEKLGFSPYYINGNDYGQGNEAVPVRAYANAYDEIPCGFDYIFLPLGTGMTQSGLIAGKAKSNRKEDIIGISVARKNSVAFASIRNYLNEYCKENELQPIPDTEISVIDDYLCGGYGLYCKNIVDIIRQMFCTSGIAMDTIYTGKAFYGMIESLKKWGIKNKRVLFIHTGGTPLFFEKMDALTL